MTSAAVHRWNAEIQEGIFNMSQLLIELVVARLQHEPVPIDLLNVLTMVCKAYKDMCHYYFDKDL